MIVRLFAAAALIAGAGCGSKTEDAAGPASPAETSEIVETAPAIAVESTTQAAADAPADTEAAAPAGAPPIWMVDRSKSELVFSGTQTGKSFDGRFGDFEATIAFDPADLAASKIIVVVSTDSAMTGDRQRDDALPGADWFAAKSFPIATFSSSQIVATGDGAYEARGGLTIRDMTKDLTLPFSLAITGDRAVADGAVTLIRTDYGVGRGEFATGQWVGLEVKVEFHIEAVR